MRFLSDKAQELGIGWNERPLTELVFYQLCARFNISVEEVPLGVSGFYFRVMGRDVIAIDSRLTGNERLKVMFHELAHFLFHTPSTGETVNFNQIGKKTREEIEADAFALCALIPKSEIVIRDNSAIDALMPDALLRDRLDVFRRHGT